ncbi:phosphotransferase [Pseudodesulfovibrio sp. JC047]|uniref:phosphotransferase enzyme family protein n=1 Tax=Pseudodesulfovibrio sp. JC047 TaxID=2683199 RepID=UPI0013D5A0AD|nr:phosphotransferase [Pseudodesulfovibrio sp. JC047]NDV19679.1 phosphotransferase [Pseudodesulfovibrio sp. JC047]
MKDHLLLWDLEPGRPRPDIQLPGSPQRCLHRAPVEDRSGTVWILEQLRPDQLERREQIGHCLATLAQKDLPIPAYRADRNGHYVVKQDHAFFQLSPFVPGTPLPQPDYIEDRTRGHALGQFLVALHEAAPNLQKCDAATPFRLETYIHELMETLAVRHPEIHHALIPIQDGLSPLFEAWPDLPTTLCHGDFHPLNIIWQEHEVAAVIDWEFSGVRPALFDVANCLGCVGIEDPLALIRGLSPTLLATLNTAGYLENDAFTLLPELILGMRFAWMSEWLRRNDTEMIDIEIQYMQLLANSIDTLLPAWKNLLGHP